MVLLAAAGCGTSSEEFVFSGANGRASRGANDVVLAVVAPGGIYGARLVENGVVMDSAAVAPSPTPDPTGLMPQQSGDFTIPGALCTAYDEEGHTEATVVVDSDGNARFDRLPTGVYRFVVTNQDSAVVMQALAGSNPRGPSFVTASPTSTVATLVTLSFNYGLDLPTYADVLAADPIDLVEMVKVELAKSGDPWVTADGRVIVDPAVGKAIAEFRDALDGGQAPSGDGTPDPDATASVTPTPLTTVIESTPAVATPTPTPSF